MCKSTKRLFALSLVFCLLLGLVPGICSAEVTYQITETELTRLEQNSAMLRTKVQKLEKDLIISQQDLTMTQEQLETYRQDLVKYQKESDNLRIQLLQQKNVSDETKKNLAALNQSLMKTTEYINQYEQESKAEIRKLTVERDIAIGLLIYDLFFRKK